MKWGLQCNTGVHQVEVNYMVYISKQGLNLMDRNILNAVESYKEWEIGESSIRKNTRKIPPGDYSKIWKVINSNEGIYVRCFRTT